MPRPTVGDRLRKDSEELRSALDDLDDDYLTTNETAALLRCSTSYLRHARARGDGPPSVVLGRKVLYRRSDIEAWADAQQNGNAR